MAGAPRFEVEIGASTADLKKGLQEARQELLKFQKEINKAEVKSAFKTEMEQARLATQNARTEAIKFANDLKASLAESLNNAKKYTEQAKQSTESYKQSLLDARRETENSKKATEEKRAAVQKEIAETQRIAQEIKKTQLESAKLTLEKRKNSQATVAAAGSYREAQQRLTALGKSIREAAGGFNSSNPAIQKQIQQYRSLNEQLKAFDARMGNFQRNVGNYPNAFGSLANAVPLVSQFGSLVGAVSAATQAFNFASKTLLNYDDNLRNVEKTTGLARKDVLELGESFVDLSKKTKVISANSLAEYASVAGQLGVSGKQDLLEFAEALAILETASNIRGEQGAAEIARLLTLTDGGVQNVKQFADEIVNLGNNFAATESEILGNASRIAQSTGTYKLGRQAVLAFAVATKSVGSEAEVTGSAIGRTLSALEGYARSTEKSTALSKLLGISQDDLRKRFKENSSGVLIDFIGALNNIDKSGGSVNQTIEELIGKSVGIKQVIGSLATGGFDVLTDSINKSANASNAAVKEFDTQSKKISAQIDRIRIASENLILTIDKGDGVFSKLASSVSGFTADTIDNFSKLMNSGGIKGFVSFLSLLNPTPGSSISTGLGSTIGDKIGRALGLDKTTENLDSTMMRGQYMPGVNVGDNFTRRTTFWDRGYASVTSEQRRKTAEAGAEYDVLGMFANNNRYKYDPKQIDNTKKATSELNNELIKNKAYWDDQVTAIRSSIEELETAEIGGKRYLQLQKELAIAQKNVDLYSKKSLIGTDTTKGKSQADIIKEATEAINNGQIEAIRGVDGEMAKIDKKWDAILEKVNEISNVGLKKQQQGLVEVGREAEKYAKFLDIYGKGAERLTRNLPTTLTGGNTAIAPSALPLLERNQDRFRVQGKQSTSTYYSEAEDMSKYMQRTLRNGLSNALNGIFDNISQIGNKSLEIEQKYAELRANASADQIASLQKMERLEKRINNGLTSTLSNLVGSIGGLGSRTISSAVGEGFSSGNFDQLKNLFKGSNKAIGYASLASSLGGVISGVSTSNAGKTFGNVLSLAGSGAAIGTSIAPGLGTAIGAVAGAIVGAISGILNSAEQRRQRELQNLQLLESKKQTALQNRIAALSYASSIIGQQSSMGVITSIDRNAFGDLVATINGQQIDLVLTRYKNGRG